MWGFMGWILSSYTSIPTNICDFQNTLKKHITVRIKSFYSDGDLKNIFLICVVWFLEICMTSNLKWSLINTLGVFVDRYVGFLFVSTPMSYTCKLFLNMSRLDSMLLGLGYTSSIHDINLYKMPSCEFHA